jgi:cyclase
MGSISGSIDALHCIQQLQPDTIVPGHGPPTSLATVDVCLRYLEWIQHSAEDAIKAGLSPLEAAREVSLDEFSDLTDTERLVGNLHRAFAECRGDAPGAPIDLESAFGDMIAYNGGRPLRCVA